MIDVLLTILEVATISLPLFIAAVLLLRSSESYDERFETSKLKFAGLSRWQYKFLFRLTGVLCVCISVFATWQFYFSDARQQVISESREFWESLERDPDAGAFLKERADTLQKIRKKDDEDARRELEELSPAGRRTSGAPALPAGAALLAAAIAIPARMGSSRFPGKPLALLGGKTVIARVFESCKKSELAERIVVLTDSPEIREHSSEIGADCIMTSPECASGTERIIEALDEIGADFVVNVQGDEPFIEPRLIDRIISARIDDRAELVTAASKIADARSLADPNVVKVLRDSCGRSLYFSRAPLPHVRGQVDLGKWPEVSNYWRHIGVYGYSAKALAKYSALPRCALERAEMLEQLRFVDAGMRFDVIETDYVSVGIDTPEDLERAEQLLESVKS